MDQSEQGKSCASLREELLVCLADVYGDSVSHEDLAQAVAKHARLLLVRLRALLARLDAHRAVAFLERYGLNDGAPKSLEQISEITHHTREHARQDIEYAKAFLAKPPYSLALFARMDVSIDLDIDVATSCRDEVETLLDEFVEYEVRLACAPFHADEEGYLVCDVDVARYVERYHEIVVPEGVRVIPIGAFALCGEALTGVQLPQSLEIIEEEAFIKTGLKTIVCPPGLREIGRGAFDGCAALAELRLNEGLEVIADWAFANCDELCDVDLPSTLLSLGAGAFEGTYVDEIYLPSGLKRCGWAADKTHVNSLAHWLSLERDQSEWFVHLFVGNEELTHADFPEGTRIIKEQSLAGLTGLRSIRLPEGLTMIEPEALDYTRIEYLYL
ncbi:MAG: leucine-rich repeat protein, partial [Clostridia bacterium]|nr:leucine-rich repeat protein [Clostridia bacterium]